MANQIKLISVDRGLDPREFVLIPFGGAGPVHASACARLLGIRRVLIPPHPGLSSAFGALAANWRVDRVWTIFGRSTHLNVAAIAERLEALTVSALQELRDDGFAGEPIILRSIDMRYAGQNYEREISLPPGPFTAEAAAGDDRPLQPRPRRVLRLLARGRAGRVRQSARQRHRPHRARRRFAGAGRGSARRSRSPTGRSRSAGSGYVETPVYRRDVTRLPGSRSTGPAIIEEPDSTTVDPPRRQATVRPDGLLELRPWLATTDNGCRRDRP